MSGAKSYNRGKIGEDIACKHLESIGHQIIKRNFRAEGGEIDIISSFENKIYFSEVKARKVKPMVELKEAITADKKARIQRAAISFLGKYFDDNTEVAFLFIFITLEINGSLKKIDVLCDCL